MNIRNTAFLFALSLSILWLFGLMLAFKKVAVDDSRVVPTLSAKTMGDLPPMVDSVMIQRSKEKDKEAEEFQFEQTGSGWTFKTGKTAIRVDKEHVDSIIEQIRTAVKNDDEKIPSDPGLDRPRVTVTLKGRLGKEKKDEQYATRDDKKIVMVLPWFCTR